MAVSSEKIDLMTDLAKSFNGSDAAEDRRRLRLRPARLQGLGRRRRAPGRRDGPTSGEGERPVIWSPPPRAGAQILNQRLADQGDKAPWPASDAVSFQLTPLVIAMPKPMADALGYPEKPVGWADLARWPPPRRDGPPTAIPSGDAFKLGKTNPNFSTSGLSALIGQAYAATGKTRDLSSEDLDNPRR